MKKIKDYSSWTVLLSIIALALVVIISFVLILFNKNMLYNNNSIESSMNEKTENNSVISGGNIAYEENDELIKIETSYVDLFYPAVWKEKLKVLYKDSEIGQSIEFYSIINEQEINIFNVHFAGDRGYPIGILEVKENHYIDVTMEIIEFSLDDSWSAEDKDLLCAMQESLNCVIENLGKQDQFEITD